MIDRILLDIPCHVCEDHSSGKHYGIYACDGLVKLLLYINDMGMSLLKMFNNQYTKLYCIVLMNKTLFFRIVVTIDGVSCCQFCRCCKK